jgi:hypothetical protein
MAYVAFAEKRAPAWQSEFAVLSPREAAGERWDAVFVPGAGFPQAMIERLAMLRQERFGTRVQHILNDQTRRQQFLKVNRSLAPHIVIFNNEDWPAGSFTEFSGQQFHTVIGGVDTHRFRPSPHRTVPLVKGRWTVGGLANKNPQPLIEAVAGMPEAVLKLYGKDSLEMAAQFSSLVEGGRLQLIGRLAESELAPFYESVDCVVITELHSGWANLAAEAMASGVPVICTRHGTTAFARHEHTALLVEQPGADVLRSSLERLRKDPELCRSLAAAARSEIERFDWQDYAEQVLGRIQLPPPAHYFAAPELGLFGKWPIQQRLDGLEPLLDRAKNLTVLDLGAAEGFIGLQFLCNGARLLHGFEREPSRVATAKRLARDHPRAMFRAANLADWTGFTRQNREFLQDRYDIVLFLGLHHHLPESSRSKTLHEAARLATRYFAYRAPDKIRESDGVDEALAHIGFTLISTSAGHDGMGGCRIYERME